MSAAAIRQDLPPEGGYKPLNFKKVPAKDYFKSKTLIITGLAVHFISMSIYFVNKRKSRRVEVENRSGDLALLPMLRAEKDRAYLQVLRKNRDEEERLMANVPGWEVGTYWGDKIYHTRPADEWHDVLINEYFAHVRNYHGSHHVNWYKWL